MAKSLESKVCEECLRSLGLFLARDEKDEGRPEPHRGVLQPLMASCNSSRRPAAPHGGLQLCTGSRGAALTLLSVTVTEGTAWSCQGRGSWGLGKGSAPEGGEHGTACPGLWVRP